MSITDSLTGLYNRRHFEQLLNTEFKTARRHGEVNSLIIIDIDHFKRINDNFGHPAGDLVLRDVARLLKKRLRSTDYLCRLGGEEFVVLCKRADKQSALNIAEEMRKIVEQAQFDLGGEVTQVTISLGVSTLSQNEELEEADLAYRQADKAVYYSKQNGRNKTAHYDDIKEHELVDEFSQ